MKSYLEIVLFGCKKNLMQNSCRGLLSIALVLASFHTRKQITIQKSLQT